MKIETGDLIAVRTAHGVMGRLTQRITSSPYTHGGIAYWLAGELFMVELNGGRNHIVPMTQLTDYDVYAHPDGLTDIEGAIKKWLRDPIDYGFSAFPLIGLLNLLHITMFIHWRKIIVCSGYCVAIWESAGWPEHSRMISPRELAALVKLKLQVRPTQPASAGFSL
jgi:hypothetical protein